MKRIMAIGASIAAIAALGAPSVASAGKHKGQSNSNPGFTANNLSGGDQHNLGAGGQSKAKGDFRN